MYVGIGDKRGQTVAEDEAFDYALEDVTHNDKTREEFVEWYFSGNWVKAKGVDEYGNIV